MSAWVFVRDICAYASNNILSQSLVHKNNMHHQIDDDLIALYDMIDGLFQIAKGYEAHEDIQFYIV